MRPGALRLLLTADAVGGVWQYALDLARALAPHGVKTLVALTGPAASAAQRGEAAGTPGVTMIDTGLDLDWMAADAATVEKAGHMVARLAAAERVDIVHLNAPALAACAEYPVPVIVAAHSCVATWWQAVNATPLPADLAWRSRLNAAGLRRADRVVAPTLAFAQATQAAHGLETCPTVIPNGRALAAGPRAEMHDCVFTAGRLWDQGKNPLVVDRVAARLGIPFKAAGATVGPHGETVKLRHLHTLGQIGGPAIAAHLAARPVFLSAARYEPFGLAVLEAAGAGCALILSDIPTFREIWDGVAVFVEPNDVDGYVRAIDAIIGDAALRLRLGALARDRAALFRPDAMAAGMLAIYRELIVAGAPARAKAGLAA